MKTRRGEAEVPVEVDAAEMQASQERERWVKQPKREVGERVSAWAEMPTCQGRGGKEGRWPWRREEED
jgi:hypothetical protein